MAETTEESAKQINLRLPNETLDGLDRWIEEINAARRVSRVNRTSVIRSLIEWGLRHRPTWAGSDPPEEPER